MSVVSAGRACRLRAWLGERGRPTRSHPPMRGSAPSPAPVRRRRPVPRLLLEVLFLAAAATAAAIAELDSRRDRGGDDRPWVLVALIEWAASRADRRRDEIPEIMPLLTAEPAAADPAWFVPPVEQTLIEPGADTPTAVTRLPPAPDDLDATVDRPSPSPSRRPSRPRRWPGTRPRPRARRGLKHHEAARELDHDLARAG